MHRYRLTLTLTLTLAAALTAILAGCDSQAGSHDDHERHADHGRSVDQAEAGHDATDAEGEGHDGYDEHQAIDLAPEVLPELGIEVAVAGPGRLARTIELPGEVRVNGDCMAHVAPRVEGVVVEVHKSLGDSVRRGELMAVLESRELADLQAEYLAAEARLRLAEAAFDREERLWQQRVSSQQEYLNARRELAEGRIALRAAGQKLEALGFSREHLEELPQQHGASFTRYRLEAPFDGSVIDRHLTQGETVEANAPVFSVADLSTVWIDLSVYQKDLGAVSAGQRVRLTTDHGHTEEASIGFVQPLVGEDTRTALARVVVPNREGHWHPGCFITAEIEADAVEVAVRVPRAAVVRVDEDRSHAVFVADEHGFEPRPVRPGRSAAGFVEIEAGLSAGERYVAEGAFALAAELAKGAFGHGHAH